MWYKKFGWKKNPFIIKSSSEIIGLNKERQFLLNYVNSNDICLILGQPGVGKTSLLQWIRKQKGLLTKNIYLNAENIDEDFNLKRKVGFPIIRKRILLLDESHNCDEQFMKELKNLWDSNKLHSVVITQIGKNLDFYPASMKSRIGHRILDLKGMDYELANELIKKRTNNNHPFQKETIKLIVDEAKNNPRKILELCEYLCIALQGKKEITVEDAKPLLLQKRADDLMELSKLEEPKEVPSNLIPIDNKKLSKYSPMQQKIILLLLEGNMTTRQLAKILNTSEGSVGKQISTLTEFKVINIINHRRPKLYGLSSDFINEIKKK